jgi:hypothetical protein
MDNNYVKHLRTWTLLSETITSLDSAGSLIDRSVELYLAFIGGYITTHVPHKATWLSTEAIVHRHKSFLICLRFFISSTFTDYFMRYLYLPQKVTSVVKRSGTTSTYEFPNLPTVFYACTFTDSIMR